jgi:hypothetical protein
VFPKLVGGETFLKCDFFNYIKIKEREKPKLNYKRVKKIRHLLCAVYYTAYLPPPPPVYYTGSGFDNGHSSVLPSNDHSEHLTRERRQLHPVGFLELLFLSSEAMWVAIDCRFKNWVAVLKSLGSPALEASITTMFSSLLVGKNCFQFLPIIFL